MCDRVHPASIVPLILTKEQKEQLKIKKKKRKSTKKKKRRMSKKKLK